MKERIFNRLDQLFNSNKNNLLNVFFTAGYPQIDSTVEVMLSLQKHGAQIMEVGIPYSDPIADGPVIQQSNLLALQNGMNLSLLFKQLTKEKENIKIPVILMGYLNPVIQYGIEKFCADANSAGVDGIILPDLPLSEYVDRYKQIFIKNQLHSIFLVTPETSIARIKKIDQFSSGFLYAVSSSGTTGKQQDINFQKAFFDRLKKMDLKNPVMVGFGISNHTGFKDACTYSRGAIIGSAYIKALKDSVNIEMDTAKFLHHILTGK
ncbi:MAG: tryptophan synthase subunit alpha [Ferruginibacter sp.]